VRGSATGYERRWSRGRHQQQRRTDALCQPNPAARGETELKQEGYELHVGEIYKGGNNEQSICVGAIQRRCPMHDDGIIFNQ
jgi:hypothetical protein